MSNPFKEILKNRFHNDTQHGESIDTLIYTMLDCLNEMNLPDTGMEINISVRQEDNDEDLLEWTATTEVNNDGLKRYGDFGDPDGNREFKEKAREWKEIQTEEPPDNEHDPVNDVEPDPIVHDQTTPSGGYSHE